jgi:hypothetical protein
VNWSWLYFSNALPPLFRMAHTLCRGPSSHSPSSALFEQIVVVQEHSDIWLRQKERARELTKKTRTRQRTDKRAAPLKTSLNSPGGAWRMKSEAILSYPTVSQGVHRSTMYLLSSRNLLIVGRHVFSTFARMVLKPVLTDSFMTHLALLDVVFPVLQPSSRCPRRENEVSAALHRAVAGSG